VIDDGMQVAPAAGRTDAVHVDLHPGKVAAEEQAELALGMLGRCERGDEIDLPALGDLQVDEVHLRIVAAEVTLSVDDDAVVMARDQLPRQPRT
jgi:hypothetical protein